MQMKSSLKVDWSPSIRNYSIKTNSDLCLRNMGAERNYNSETVSL